MALRPAQGSTLTIAHAGFNSGTPVAVPQLVSIPLPQSTPNSVDLAVLDQAVALSVGAGATYSDVTFDVGYDPTIGASGAKSHQELYNLGHANVKTNVTFVSSLTNNASGATVITWVGQVVAANINATAGGAQVMTVTVRPQSETSVSFA